MDKLTPPSRSPSRSPSPSSSSSSPVRSNKPSTILAGIQQVPKKFDPGAKTTKKMTAPPDEGNARISEIQTAENSAQEVPNFFKGMIKNENPLSEKDLERFQNYFEANGALKKDFQAKFVYELVSSQDDQFFNKLMKYDKTQNLGLMNRTSEDGTTPLLLALEKGDVQCVKRLLEGGANADQKVFGMTPLFIAVSHPDLFPCVEILLSNGADVNLTSYNKETALYHAVKLDNQLAVQKLLENGADPNIANIDGLNPFDIAQNKFLKHSLIFK